MKSLPIPNRKRIAWFLLSLMVVHCLAPTVTYALTSGPSQPEVQSFEPVGTTDMVDLFTGDFTYNIPLFELPGPNGGYPFNLAYHAGIGMDQEASWCGLGWNLNPGAVTRQMRGLPDEFKGDVVTTKNAIKPSVTAGVAAGVGTELFGGTINVGLGLSIYNNNYRGVGYSIDGSAGAGAAFGSGATAGVNVGLNLDSQGGANLSPSIGLSQQSKKYTSSMSVGLGAGYSSREGLRQISLNTSIQNNYTFKPKKEGGESRSESIGVASASSPLSLANPGYTPQISMPMRNVNLSATIKVGAAWWGVHPHGYVRGFFHEQWLKNNGKEVSNDAYGYLNYQYAPDEAEVMMDLNREKEGIVRKESPNLAIPSLTYDIYSVNGQGLSAMYRPFRSDVGTVHDPVVTTYAAGGSFGADVAPALAHVGVNASVNYGDSYSGPWRGGDPVADRFAFQSASVNNAYEPWYFKAHGEPSGQSSGQYDALGKDKPVRVKLGGLRIEPVAEDELESETITYPAPDSRQDYRERTPRSQVITPITNEELLAGSQEVLSAFRVSYLNESGNTTTLSRTAYPGHHVAGITALTPEGLRYHYALPAYNHTQEDVQFSAVAPSTPGTRVNTGGSGDDPAFEHNNTDKFLSRTITPAYAHAHLLTSIVGPDYVDVTGDGVTADDLGYWVKFTYQRATNNYQWRAPFSQAIYQEGFKTTPQDDRGSFSYGSKEVWYLARAETKSHVARFITEARTDGQGVSSKLQDTDTKGEQLYRLKEVKLFTRSAGESTPLLKVKLDHDYTLCPGAPNATAGKLTLNKVWFEYGSSDRGSLNPYQFSYHGENLAYQDDSYDRWGQYRPAPSGDPLYNQEFPYVHQDPSDKGTLDAQAAAWSLATIKLPSGGQIFVDYETDDYAYVQHRPAMQMMTLVNPTGSASESGTFALDHGTLKVRFKLEQPLSGELSAAEQEAEVMRYLETTSPNGGPPQVYFKLLMNLLKPGAARNEFITGYADIDLTADVGLEKEGSDFAYGYFYLKAEQGYHPFQLRGWQHLRSNQPDLINPTSKMNQVNSDKQKVEMIKGLVTAFKSVRELFDGFYGRCDGEQWAKEVVAGKSWVRLLSPDQIKYGGGLRVRQITMQDNWEHDQEGVYGQVYQYTTEEDGRVISSGVAANEPLMGGDETALRYAKPYTESVPLRSDNNLFFEYPINESYYPGPQVGYSKVSVKSLAAASLAGELARDIQLDDGDPLFPAGAGVSYGTTGMTVHEFYTARNFPVIAEETDKDYVPFNLSVPIPLIGHTSVSKLTASQGYSVQTNDMHGKPKRVSHYRQDKEGRINPAPISWVAYHYLSEDEFYEGEAVASLTNGFVDNNDQTVSVAADQNSANVLMGQENEFFVDMREHFDLTTTGGVNINTDVVIIPALFIPVPVPIPSVWPMASSSQQQLKTVVTNKVIFRKGILQRTEAYNEGSLIETEHIRWDKLTGQPVLSTVNNNYDAPVFSYSLPAYHAYEGMGGAYQNVGMRFTLQDVSKVSDGNIYQFVSSSLLDDINFVSGDEWILYSADGTKSAVGTGVFVGKEDNTLRFHANQELTGSTYVAKVYRSGNRNHLNPHAGSVQALQNPVQSGSNFSYTKSLTVPIP